MHDSKPNAFSFNFLFFLLLVGPWYASAQEFSITPPNSFEVSTASIDTSKLLSDKPLKSPMGAVLRSAVLPGWGQAYTHHYIKAGVALSANAFLVYNIFMYQHRWKDTGNKDFQGKRNLYTWYFSLAYLLTMADAYVDAYLYKFNEAMQLAHQIDYREGKWSAQICLSYHF
ncbi:MAG: DUF5683 domain-containing protein [Calditrichia bacterium]